MAEKLLSFLKYIHSIKFCKYGISAARSKISVSWFSVLNKLNLLSGYSECDEHFRIKIVFRHFRHEIKIIWLCFLMYTHMYIYSLPLSLSHCIQLHYLTAAFYPNGVICICKLKTVKMYLKIICPYIYRNRCFRVKMQGCIINSC